MDEYFATAGWRGGAFAGQLALATALHDFGGDFTLRLCRETGTAPTGIDSLAALEALVVRRLSGIE